MKTKKFSKRLDLNKKTVADLSGKDMNDVFGGISGTGPCITYLGTCGPYSCGPAVSNCYSEIVRHCPCY
jgi:hypothetical protein